MTMLIAILFAATLAHGSVYPMTDPTYIRVTGRTAPNGTALFADWSSVYVEAVATGPLALILQERWSHGNEYWVQITPSDTTSPSRSFQLNTTNATSETHFDLRLQAGHTAAIRVEKVTEARVDAGGLVRLVGLEAAKLHLLSPSALYWRFDHVRRPI